MRKLLVFSFLVSISTMTFLHSTCVKKYERARKPFYSAIFKKLLEYKKADPSTLSDNSNKLLKFFKVCDDNRTTSAGCASKSNRKRFISDNSTKLSSLFQRSVIKHCMKIKDNDTLFLDRVINPVK